MTEVFYQNHRCLSAHYTRTRGCGPDFGTITLPRALAKRLVLHLKDGLWPSSSVGQPALPFDIVHVEELKKSVGQTAVQPPEQAEGEGFDLFGTLRYVPETAFNPELPETPHEGEPVEIQGIFVDTNGLAEITEDLLERNETDGVVEIGITDVRVWWAEFGRLTIRANRTLPGSDLQGRTSVGTENIKNVAGSLDRTTTNVKLDPTGDTPFTIDDLLRVVIAHLPMSPRVLSIDESLSKEIPLDIEAENVIPGRYLAHLLDLFGLDIDLNLDNSVSIFRISRTHEPKQFAGATIPDTHLSGGPMSSFYWNLVVPTAMVVGERIHQNVTTVAVPVSLGLDGKVHPLDQVIEEFNYTREKMLREMFVEEEKRFNSLVSDLMKRIANACFLKWFQILPITASPFGPLSNLLPIRNRSVIDDGNRGSDDFEKMVKEILNEGAPEKERSTTQNHKVASVAPRVVARYFEQRDFLDPAIFVQQLKKYVNKFLTKRGYLIKELDKAEDAADLTIRKTTANWETKNFNPEKIRREYKLGKPHSEDGSFKSHFETRGIDRGSVIVEENAKRAKNTDEARAQRRQEELAEKERILKPLKDEEKKWYEMYQAAVKAIDEVENAKEPTNRGNLSGWFNSEGIVPTGFYRIIEDQGLIIFNQPCAHTDEIFARNFPDFTPRAEYCHPIITFGIEHNQGTHDDFVNVIVTLDEKGEPQVKAVNGQVYAAPKMIHAPNLRLFLDETGRPFNLEEVKQKAIEAARPYLTQPAGERAWRYVCAGSWPVRTGFNGVTSVSWNFDGDVMLTEITANEYQFARRSPSLQRKRRDFPKS